MAKTSIGAPASKTATASAPPLMAGLTALARSLAV
jgi:hypothetical protein